MKLTVVCCAFNAESYLEESLDSLLDQTFNDFELILVDDGSSDNTRNIMIEYQKKFKECSILTNQHNEGIPVSRNRALLASKGDLIAIHDADDVSLPTRFEKERNFLINNNSTVVGSYAVKINHNSQVIGNMVYPPKETAGAFSVISRFCLNPIIDPSSMFIKNTVLKHGGYSMSEELKTALDFDLWCRLLCHGYFVSNIQEFLIKYRINPNGITKTKEKDMREATKIIHARFMNKNFKDPILRPNIFKQDCYGQIL